MILHLSLGLFAGPILASPDDPISTRVVAGVRDVLTQKAYATGVDFGRCDEIIARRSERLARATTEDEIAAAVNEALAEFGVSHLNLLTPRESSERAAGKRLSAGVTVEKIDEGLLVCSAVEGGPAAEAGVHAGDVITAIDGMPANDAAIVSGHEGQTARWKWMTTEGVREGVVTFRPHRRASPDSLSWPSKDVALIEVHSFADGLYDRQQIKKFFDDAGAARAIILDLRSNKGGNAENVEHLLGQVAAMEVAPFVDIYREDGDRWQRAHPGEAVTATAIVSFVAPDGRRPTIPCDDSVYPGPLVVLIDSQCGSGGELAPAALQRLHRAKVIGTRSRGKVRIGQNFRLSGGFELQAPIGEFIAPDGSTIEGVGVIPDVELTPRETATGAVIVARALQTVDH